MADTRDQIVFEMGVNLYLVNADGAGLTQLTTGSGVDSSPRWSPDGRRIAFLSGRGGHEDIWIIDLETGAMTQITNDVAQDMELSWSPDGQRISFRSVTSDYDRRGVYLTDDLYVVNTDGSGLTNITNIAEVWTSDEHAAWSPDGQHAVFVSNREGGDEIYLMNTDGSALTRLTSNSARDWNPQWSPDGSRIVFNSNRDGKPSIYVMKPDGSEVIRLTGNPTGDSAGDARWSIDLDAQWSSDGARIAFVSTWFVPAADPKEASIQVSDIFVVNADGSGIINLTDDPAQDGLTFGPDPAFDWSPDDTRIVFISDRDGNDELYVMNADGSGVTRLTVGARNPTCPVWSPVR